MSLSAATVERFACVMDLARLKNAKSPKIRLPVEKCALVCGIALYRSGSVYFLRNIDRVFRTLTDVMSVRFKCAGLDMSNCMDVNSDSCESPDS